MKKFIAAHRITFTVFLFGMAVLLVHAVANQASVTVPTSYACTIDRVYDGDTFFVTIEGWPDIVGKEIGVRIKGIDTPELRGSSVKEKQLAHQATLVVRQLLLEKPNTKIQLYNLERGKYFRLVADVTVDNINVAHRLIELGLAVPYDGGTKTKDWSK
jgi:endonuclease YncB( thermonuclease family)